ncbi:uncharacterized protein N7511_002320 [Penicillium nucicola]|uniref:uncharacterized protein n=1 Tax=Penicillium nucicola TaxID=1850975 RepID=UPI002545B24A|nr:uncharacterized protein N7511_002320 [Penicillium nucicola]KAJ5770269.1 hypothetical protein N7511_002320 [Penicillium nucicola]
MEKFPLSPLDELVHMSYPGFLFSFTPEKPEDCISALQNAVKSLLPALPFLAGEVIPRPGLQSSGVEGINNVSHVVLPSCQDPAHTFLTVKHHNTRMPSALRLGEHSSSSSADANDDLYPLPIFLHPSEKTPTFRMQANIFLDGGIALGLNLCHRVLDGKATYRIIQLLAQCCCEPQTSLAPFSTEQQNGLRKAIFLHQPEPESLRDFPTQVIAPEPTPLANPQQSSQLPPSPHTRRFLFSAAAVKSLHNRCSQTIHTSFVSRGDILTSAVSIAIARTRTKLGRGSCSVDISMAVDLRNRLSSPISKDYLGNMSVPNSQSCLNTELEKQTDDISQVAHVASLLRQGITSMDEGWLDSLLSDKKDKDTTLGVLNIVHTNLREMPFYNLDFGPQFGKMTNVNAFLGPVDGLVIIHPERTGIEDPAWEVQISLNAEELDLLSRDFLIGQLMN